MYSYMYPTVEQFKESINLIQKSVEGEKEDSLFYQWLIDNIPKDILSADKAEEIKTIIESIRDDEMSHNKEFKKMYRELTGRTAKPKDEEFIPPKDFKSGIEKALKGELEAVRRYRKIMMGLPNNFYRDRVFNILSDELRHASLYNYIYTIINTTKPNTEM